MNETEKAKVRPAVTTFFPMLPWAAALNFFPVAIIIAILKLDLTDGVLAGAAVVAVVTPFIILLCVVCALTLHVRVYTNGVSSYDPYGFWKRDFTVWEDMQKIRRVSVIGVPYARIDTHHDGSLWIPLSVLGDPALSSAVEQFAPESKLAIWMKDAI